jgi:hypothetical protein
MPWFLNDDFEKDDWSDICVVVWEYIDKVADDNGQAKVDLFSKYEYSSNERGVYLKKLMIYFILNYPM